MSLYYESSLILDRAHENSSLKSLVFGNKTLKSKPAQVYALLVEAIKWSPVLSAIIDKIRLLQAERKLTPTLALLLTHDLLLSKGGIAAPKQHGLKLSIEKHKSRLSAEFTKARVKAGFATLDDWSKSIAAQDESVQQIEKQTEVPQFNHPRWIRINTLRSTLVDELGETFADFINVSDLEQVLRASSDRKVLARDEHISDLIAIPPGYDLTKNLAYTNGRIIFQDKASCFPAVLLDPQVLDGDFLDACAAPGNKTTHLAALVNRNLSQAKTSHSQKVKIYACERDKARGATLQKMVSNALAGNEESFEIECLVSQDFLKLDPNSTKFKKVGAILLDPSCSGSGIVGRDNSALVPNYPLVLPRPLDRSKDTTRTRRKRKRGVSPQSSTNTAGVENSNNEYDANDDLERIVERLRGLSSFQLSMIEHAFSFPSARKIVYSTCSIHAEENEHVVIRALRSSSCKDWGWRLCSRAEQVQSLQNWDTRGKGDAVETYFRDHKLSAEGAGLKAQEITEACIRCTKQASQGTMGFFTVMFVRDGSEKPSFSSTGLSKDLNGNHCQRGEDEANTYSHEERDEEWNGFSDDND